MDPMLGGEGRTHISRPGSFRAGPGGRPMPTWQVWRGHRPWPGLGSRCCREEKSYGEACAYHVDPGQFPMAPE